MLHAFPCPLYLPEPRRLAPPYCDGFSSPCRSSRNSQASPAFRVLQQRSLEHEKAYIAGLRSQGLAVADLSEQPEESAPDSTWAAMTGGAQAIVRPASGMVTGEAAPDVLLRVEQPGQPSRLGNWSYEVVDCKLA